MARLVSIASIVAPLLFWSAAALAANSNANLNAAAEPAGAGSDTMTKVTLEDIQAVLQDDGYRAQLKHDDTGDYVSSSSGGRSFFISLGACDDQKLCKSLLMETGGWTPTTAKTVADINKFSYDNGGWIAVMTYNDGKYYGDYRVALVGGITRDWLKYTLETFAASTENFAAFMQK